VNIGDYAAAQAPDIVGSLRVDQAWGSAQIAGALHQVRAGYYGNNNTANAVLGPGGYTGFAPADKWGYAIMAGIVINLPWAKGDQFWIEGAYTVGAVSYTGWNQNGQYSNFDRFNGGYVAAAWPLDAVFANVIGPGRSAPVQPAQRSRTDHGVDDRRGSPALLDAGSAHVSVRRLHGDRLQRQRDEHLLLVAGRSGPHLLGATPNFATGAVLGCNPDFNVWAIGSRTIWNPVPNLDIGVEVVYTKLEQKHERPTRAGRGVLMNFGGAAVVRAASTTSLGRRLVRHLALAA
jgi:hypothetical protein